MERGFRLLARNLGVCATAFVVLTGCSDSRALPPTVASPPAPTPQPTPQGTYTVSGVVSALAGRLAEPLAGVHVEDSERHVFVNTGPDGSYTIADVANSPSLGHAYIYFQKNGYRSQSRQFLLTGDTRLDVTLVRE